MYKKMVVLDSVIFYPEHRQILNGLAEEILEYPSSIPQSLEKQYEDSPELFKNKKCYTALATDNIPQQLLMNRIEGADVIISCWTDIPDEVLEANPQLRLIIFWTHEKEHRINMSLANKLGITVTNVPDYGTDSVTEVVFAGLWEVLQRNMCANQVHTEESITHGILHDLFRAYRKLPTNEKNTRMGKFTHHFHKLGQVDFSFSEKVIRDLIPEQLIEGKQIGLLHPTHTSHITTAFKAFKVRYTVFDQLDTDSAEYYKFLTEHERIYADFTKVEEEEMTRIERLFPSKLVDTNALASIKYDFSQKVFGVVGLGRIGTRVAKIAKELGFTVVYFSRTRKPELEQSLGIEFRPLEKLVEEADVISLHVPAHHAENLISKDLVEKMKAGSIFINTADGNAVDQTTLTTRMQKNEVFVYLDVYPGLPRKDNLELPMAGKKDWKIKSALSQHVLAYRAGWKTQESIRIKTFKLLGALCREV